MKSKVKTLTVFSSILLMSCNDRASTELKSENTQPPITYRIDFPDTVYVDQPNDGIVHYESVLDTIITTFGDGKIHRYARFILDNEPQRIAVDTFGALNNREIPFYDVKFSNEGVHYLQGVINDIVLLDTSSNPQDLIKLITNEVPVKHKVVVVSKN